jgi:hypothetical protein
MVHECWTPEQPEPEESSTPTPRKAVKKEKVIKKEKAIKKEITVKPELSSPVMVKRARAAVRPPRSFLCLRGAAQSHVNWLWH